MEQIKRIITIDLQDYGMDGTVEVRMPSARKQNEFKNQMGRYIKMDKGQKTLADSAPIGDIEIAMAMLYVSKAPFATTVEGFLKYTDDMEPEQSSALMARLNEAMMEIDGSSPFVGSP